MITLTADTKIKVKMPRTLTGDTKIRLSQIKDLAEWVEDRRYQVGQISEKTGLQKQPDGSWKEPSDKNKWTVPRSMGAAARKYIAKTNVTVRKGKEKSYTLKEGSAVSNIEIIAKGHGIKRVTYLRKKYKRPNGKTTNTTDWTKKKGVGIVVDKNGKEMKAELHWYECQGIGKVEFKVKKWKDEQ